MNFAERLREYREVELRVETKKKMAEMLGISQQLYAMLERGERNPSKKILSLLVAFSGMPASYWIYGINEEQTKERYSFLDKNVNDLIEKGLIDKDGNFDSNIETLLIAALKLDIKNIVKDDE